MKCSMMNAKGFRSGTRNTTKPTSDTMCSISSGSSASSVSSFSAWPSSCYSIAITTGRAKPSQHGLWDSFWEGLARRPLGEANNKPTDNRHFCWKSVGLIVLLSILIRWLFPNRWRRWRRRHPWWALLLWFRFSIWHNKLLLWSCGWRRSHSRWCLPLMGLIIVICHITLMVLVVEGFLLLTVIAPESSSHRRLHRYTCAQANNFYCCSSCL